MKTNGKQQPSLCCGKANGEADTEGGNGFPGHYRNCTTEAEDDFKGYFSLLFPWLMWRLRAVTMSTTAEGPGRVQSEGLDEIPAENFSQG